MLLPTYFPLRSSPSFMKPMYFYNLWNIKVFTIPTLGPLFLHEVKAPTTIKLTRLKRYTYVLGETPRYMRIERNIFIDVSNFP